MIWTMKPTAKKLEDVETKVGNVGSTDLQSQVTTLNNKVGNVGSTDLQSQVNTLNSNLIPSYAALTLESGITGTLRLLRMGKLRSIYGSIKPGSAGAEILVCTLASTDRPPIKLQTSYSGYSANVTGEVSITSDGRLTISVNSAPSNELKFNITYATN